MRRAPWPARSRTLRRRPCHRARPPGVAPRAADTAGPADDRCLRPPVAIAAVRPRRGCAGPSSPGPGFRPCGLFLSHHFSPPPQGRQRLAVKWFSRKVQVAESLLLSVTRISTFAGERVLTAGSGFFFERDGKLFL